MRPRRVLSAAFTRVQPSTELKHPALVAPTSVAIATLARLLLDPVLKDHGPFLFFAIAVVVAALYGGTWAGLGAILLSLPLCDYLFIEPRYTWFIYDARGDSLMLFLFATLGVLTTLVIDRFHRNRRHLNESLIHLRRTEAELEAIDATIPGALFTATEDGAAEHLNGFFSKYSGQELHTLIGRGWLDLVHPDDRAGFEAELASARNGVNHFENIIRLRRSDGAYRSFKCEATRSFNPDTKTTKWFGVCSDIHNERTLAAALEARTHELARLNEALERFAYAASHDLQEPLRTIAATTQQFLRRAQDSLDAQSAEMLAAVLNSTDRMKHLIRDIMALARSSNTAENRAEVDMQAVVATALANLGHAIDESAAKIHVDQLPVLYADETAMLRVLQNLIANAIKFRGAHEPRICVSASLCGEEYVFSIRDNGIGIEPQYCEKIFEPFHRLHSRSKYEGSGLGLAACRRIVNSLQGKMWVESKPGEGSTFFFTIPHHVTRKGFEMPGDPKPDLFNSSGAGGGASAGK